MLGSNAERRVVAHLAGHPLATARLFVALRRRGNAEASRREMREAVRAELSPFASRGIRAEDVERQWALLRDWDPHHAVRVRRRAGRVTASGPGAVHERGPWLRWAIGVAADAAGLGDFELLATIGDFIDYDMEHAPVLVFGRKRERRGQLSIPDFEALRGHEPLESRVDRASRARPWASRSPVLFWRGASTGGEFDRPGWESFPRVRLVALSRERSELVDARFTRLVQGAERIPRLKDPSWLGSVVTPVDSLRYRYLADVDGNASSWSRMVWLLRSGSLVVKQRSPFVQWYYPWLEPGRHYLELSPDLGDLEEKVQWAIDHDEEAKKIADRARAFAETHLGRLSAFAYLIAAIEEQAALAR